MGKEIIPYFGLLMSNAITAFSKIKAHQRTFSTMSRFSIDFLLIQAKKK